MYRLLFFVEFYIIKGKVSFNINNFNSGRELNCNVKIVLTLHRSNFFQTWKIIIDEKSESIKLA